MKNYLFDFIKTYAIFLIVDYIYLMVLRGDFIRGYFSKFGGIQPWVTVFGPLAWALLAFGLEYFVIQRALNPMQALISGAIFGFVVYGVYDFTNISTLKGWTLSFTIQDVLWGTVLCAFIAYVRQSI